MKKRLLFVAAIFAATATFAQDGLTSKKGEAYLPEAGDWSIGIDANPVLNYAGNLFNGTTSQTFGGANWFSGVPGGTIYGKMFKDEKTAYIGMLRIGFGSTSSSTIFEHTLPGATAPTEFTDKATTSYNNIVLGGGIEKRRGNTRIQGVYGAMINIGFGGSSSKTDYGVAITADTTIAVGLGGARTTETKNGSTFSLGLNGFIGAEWFFAPKVSLGAKYTWGLAMNSTGDGETTKEYWGTAAGAAAGTANSAQTKTTKTGGSSNFSLDTGISGASISLNLHF